jgi:hypothetical protein
MRPVWLLAVLFGACGDNVRPPRLDRIAQLPAGTLDVAFDPENVAAARTSSGVVQRLVGTRWQAVAMAGASAVDFGTDTDGTLLVMCSIPRKLFQLDGSVPREIGGIVIANVVHMPVQVPSGNRYVQEVAAPHRSFVLSPGAQTWAETPPMFFSRPVRTHDGVLLSASAAGIQRFEPDNTRTLLVACSDLGKQTCTQLVIAGLDEDRLIVADTTDSELLFVEGSARSSLTLPEDLVPVRAVTGDEMTVILAKRDELDPADEAFFLFALTGRTLERLDSAIDPPTMNTRLAVDREGAVHVATKLLSKVLP